MLPEPVKRFCYAANGLGAVARRTRWGIVIADPRYADIFDANNAAVLEPDPDLTLDEIQSELHPPLRRGGARREHIEFWETSMESPALRLLRATRPPQRADVVMVAEEEPGSGEPPSGVLVEEIKEPDDAFWPWLRSSLNEFGTHFSEPVLDQMVARIREVFLPAGMRWFVGLLDGERAGYASLVSVDGVGYLDDVVTMPSFRRRGVASATVLRAVAASANEGDDSTFLLAEEGGDPSRLYERLGFRVRARVESFTHPLPD